MPATYEPIASQTLSANAADVTFSSIPGTYTDLVVVAVTNNVDASVGGLRMRVNSDTGSNYSTTILYGDGASALSERVSSQTLMRVGNTSNSSGSPAVSVIQVMSYANTNVFKTVLNSGALASTAVARNVNLWRSTSAITSVTLFSDTVNLKSGCTFSIFGVKAA